MAGTDQGMYAKWTRSSLWMRRRCISLSSLRWALTLGVTSSVMKMLLPLNLLFFRCFNAFLRMYCRSPYLRSRQWIGLERDELTAEPVPGGGPVRCARSISISSAPWTCGASDDSSAALGQSPRMILSRSQIPQEPLVWQHCCGDFDFGCHQSCLLGSWWSEGCTRSFCWFELWWRHAFPEQTLQMFWVQQCLWYLKTPAGTSVGASALGSSVATRYWWLTPELC